MNKNIYTALAALSLTISVAAEEMRFSELPNAAQRTINRNLYGGVVQEIDRDTVAYDPAIFGGDLGPAEPVPMCA